MTRRVDTLYVQLARWMRRWRAFVRTVHRCEAPHSAVTSRSYRIELRVQGDASDADYSLTESVRVEFSKQRMMCTSTTIA